MFITRRIYGKQNKFTKSQSGLAVHPESPKLSTYGSTVGGGSTDIVAGTQDIIIPAYTDTELTVKGDADLIASNILKGKEIFGVTGTLVKGITGVAKGTITPSSDVRSITITHNLGSIPTYFLVVWNEFTSGTIYSSSDILFAIGLPKSSNYVAFGNYASYKTSYHSSSAMTTTAITLTAPGTITTTDYGRFKSGKTYNWVAVA